MQQIPFDTRFEDFKAAVYQTLADADFGPSPDTGEFYFDGDPVPPEWFAAIFTPAEAHEDDQRAANLMERGIDPNGLVAEYLDSWRNA